MPLIIPSYIKKSGILDIPINHIWKDPWECYFEVPRLRNKIGPLYSRCILALGIAFSEWIIWRFSKLSKDPVFFHFIEAAWASVVDRRYLRHRSQSYGARIEEHYKISEDALKTDDYWTEEDLRDPIRGPLFVAIHTLGEVIDRTAPKDFGSMETVYLSNLAEQVLNNLALFKKWRREVIMRLSEYYLTRLEDEIWLGTPVPREAFDLEYDYKPGFAKELLNNYLKSLDYSTNPFLLSPEEMKKIGFKGTPYVWK